MTQKHTPEPWGNATHGVSSLSMGGGGRVNMSFDDYSRAVACVNACQGMDDPAAEIAALKQRRDELLNALEKAVLFLGNNASCSGGFLKLIAKVKDGKP